MFKTVFFVAMNELTFEKVLITLHVLDAELMEIQAAIHSYPFCASKLIILLDQIMDLT
jgi:hypothetical protein